MADIQIAGPRMSLIQVAGLENCTLVAKLDEDPSGVLHSLSLMIGSGNSGYLISTDSCIGSPGSVRIDRCNSEGFSANQIEISQDNRGTFVVMGIQHKKIALARFPDSRNVAFGKFPGGNLQVLKTTDKIYLSRDIRTVDNHLGTCDISDVSYFLNNNRIYFFATPECSDPFQALCYLELVNGFPCFRFSCASITLKHGELLAAVHLHQKVDARSLSQVCDGYFRIPEISFRSLLFYNCEGHYAGTMHVSQSGDDSIAQFASGDISWEE